MALTLELWERHQLDFSIDYNAVMSLMDAMLVEGELICKYNPAGEPVFTLADIKQVMEKLDFTLLPKVQNGSIVLILFSPPPIRMYACPQRDDQPFTRSSSSGT